MQRDLPENSHFLLDNNETPKKLGAIEEIARWKLSPGTLLWTRQSGKVIELLRPGDVVDLAYLEKFKKIEQDIKLRPMVNDHFIKEGALLWGKLNQENNSKKIREKDRVEIRDEILNWSAKSIWYEEVNISQLDLIHLGLEVFYDLPEEWELKFKEKSLDCFKRSALMGTAIVHFALTLGYLNFQFLKDLYHACFLVDYSLLDKGLSSDDIKWLEYDRMGGESTHFSGVGEESFKLIEDSNIAFINSKFVKRLIKLCHERLNGKGSSPVYCEHSMSDLEVLWILLHRSFSFDETTFTEGDGRAFLFELLRSKTKESDPLISKRVKRIINSYFENILNDDDEFLELGGL